jgi:hypothetical protein
MLWKWWWYLAGVSLVGQKSGSKFGYSRDTSDCTVPCPTSIHDRLNHKQRKMAGNNSDFVLLESMDGYSFVVSRSVACASGMLKSMLDEESESPLFSLSSGVN